MPYTINTAKATILDGLGNPHKIDVFSGEVEQAQQEALAAVEAAKTSAVSAVDAASNRATRLNNDTTATLDETANMIAEDFVETKAYKAGAYVRKEVTSGSTTVVKLYRLTADYTANAGWNSASKVEVKLGNEVTDLKSAITEQTRNLIAGKIVGTTVDGNGIIVVNQNYDMLFAPIESGKTYTVSTNDTSGFVYGLFTSVPAIGSVSTGGRVISQNKTFTASASGYIAFRSMSGYEQAQIEEGTSATAYIQPLSAVDVIARNNETALSSQIATNLTREFYTLGQGITPTRIASFAGFDVFADMNNVGTGLFRNNSVYRYADFGSSDVVAHAPVTPFNGYLLTFGDYATTTLYQQMAITNTGVVFVRNSTSDWRRNIDLSEFNSFLSAKDYVEGFQTGLTPERIAEGATYEVYNDLNNIGLAEAPSNSIIRYANFNTPDLVAHSPVAVFNGIVLSVSQANVSTELMQIAMDTNGLLATRYLRRGYNATYPWHIIERPVYNISNATDLFNLLQTITTGVINLREFEYDMYTGLYENLILADNTTRHFIDGDIDIIGAGTRLKLHIPQAVAEAHLSAANVTSIIDILGNAKITGVIFDCKNTRYCCHYEASTNMAAFYKKVTFEDCEFHYTRELSGLNADCVGIGGSLGQNFTFRNCKFYNDIKGGIYIHTRSWCIGSLNVENCLFDCGWYGINLSQYTGTDAPIPVYIVNSKVGLVLISTQSGGRTAMQWEVNYINSRYTQTIGEGSTLMYEPIVFDITAQ